MDQSAPPTIEAAISQEMRAVLDECFPVQATDGEHPEAPIIVTGPGASPATVQKRFTATWAGDLKVRTTNAYIIKGLIPSECTGQIYGATSGGKTAFAVDMLVSVASGTAYRGHKVRACPVVIFALENPASIRHRVLAACRHRGIDPAGVPLLVVQGALNLLRPTEAAEIIKLLTSVSERHGPVGLVIYDTLAWAMPGGDEDTAKAMTQVMGTLNEVRLATGATQILIHHSGKDESRGSRGSSALPAAVDVEIHIQNHVAEAKKVRDGKEGAQYGFRLEGVVLGQDEDGDDIQSVVAVADDSVRKKSGDKKLAGKPLLALRTLAEVTASKGQPAPQVPGLKSGTKAVTEETWREAFYTKYGEESSAKTGRARNAAFTRAKEKLLEAKLIEIAAPWVWRAGKEQAEH